MELDFINKYLLLPPKDFERIITNDANLGKELYDLVYFKMGYSKIIDILKENYSHDNVILAQCELNLDKLYYYYVSNIYSSLEIKTNNRLSNKFNLNEDLKEEIVKDMPYDYTLLQKAYYVYKRLCEKFYYDEVYFCYKYGTITPKDKPKIANIHKNIKRLNDIKINEGVICSEITMIYAKFLELLGINYQLMSYDGNLSVRYGSTHFKLRFQIRDYLIDADAAHGLYSSDLSLEKEFGKVKNFYPAISLPLRIQDKIFDELRVVDKYFKNNKENNEFNNALEIYEDLYKTNTNLSFTDKVEIFKNIINSLDVPYITSFDWVKTMQKDLFGNDDRIIIEYLIKNRTVNNDYELVLAVIYNEDESVYNNSLNNEYLIISRNADPELITFVELFKRLKNQVYDYTSPDRITRFNKLEGENDEMVGRNR